MTFGRVASRGVAWRRAEETGRGRWSLGDGLEIVLFLDRASSRSKIGESYEVFSPRPAMSAVFARK